MNGYVKQLYLLLLIFVITMLAACKKKKIFRDALVGSYFCYMHTYYVGQYWDSTNHLKDFTDDRVYGYTTIIVEKSHSDTTGIVIYYHQYNGTYKHPIFEDSITVRYGTPPHFVGFYNRGDSVDLHWGSQKSKLYNEYYSDKGHKIH